MIKKVLKKVFRSKEGAMNSTRRCLEREGIAIKTFDVYTGILETEHVHVRFIFKNEDGIHDYDIGFDFETTDNVWSMLKPYPEPYAGSLTGYIIKTEAEETLKEEQEKLKRQQKLLLNSTFGATPEGYRGGLHLPYQFRVEKEKEFAEYCVADVMATSRLFTLENEIINHKRIPNIKSYIKKVVFNDPATIIFWTDDTKTVVKAENEPFDPEKGMAMAIAKKVLGNKHDYYNTFKKHLKKYKRSDDATIDAFTEFKIPTSDGNINKAYHVLMRAMTKDKALKADYEQAVEEAVGYLGAAMEG